VRFATSRLVPALDQGSTGSGTSPSQNPQGCSWPSISRLCERAALLMSRASARPVFPAHPYPRTKAFVRGRSTPRGRRALGVAQTLLACGRATAAAESDCSTRALEEERRRRTLEVVKFRGYQHRKGVRWIPHRLIIERADYVSRSAVYAASVSHSAATTRWYGSRRAAPALVACTCSRVFSAYC
jgi:hypothetical protein